MKTQKKKLKLRKEIKIILFILINVIVLMNIHKLFINVNSVNDLRYNQLVLVFSYLIYAFTFIYTFIKD